MDVVVNPYVPLGDRIEVTKPFFSKEVLLIFYLSLLLSHQIGRDLITYAPKPLSKDITES